jgi:hypothetical protein
MSYFSSVAINSNMPDSLTSGSLSAVNNTVQLNLAGHKSCACTIGGTWSGNLVVESSADNGANWIISWVQAVTPAISSSILAPINSLTTNGNYSFFITAGITSYRVRVTNTLPWTGTATVTMASTEVPGPNFNSSTIVQNILSDTLNISYTNLQPLSSYIGLASSTLGIAGIQMTFKSDQNCQITVDQSGVPTAGIGVIATTANSTALSGLSGTKFTRDFIVGDEIFVSGEFPSVVTSIASDTSMIVSLSSVNTANKTYTQYFWDVHDVTNYNPITDNFGQTFQAVGLFYRVRLKNVSPTTATTYLRMSIALCPIVEALPRALSDAGNLKTAVYEIADGFGNTVGISPHHTLRTSSTFKLVGSKFGNSVDTNFWTLTSNGTASANAVSNGINTLSSGTANAGYAQTQSVRLARYSGGIPNLYRAQHRMPTVAAALNTRRFGAFTVATRVPQDGFYFEVSPAGVLSVNYVRDASVQSVSSGNFNGSSNFFTLDTNGHVYEIVYAFSQVDFIIDGKMVHIFTPTTSPLTSDMDLPITTQSINGASGTTSGVLENWFCGINRMGEEAAAPKWVHVVGATGGGTLTQLKTGAGRLRSININTLEDGAAIRIYDATSATNAIGLITIASGNQGAKLPVNMTYNLDFYTGLYAVVIGATTDVTFIYE